MEHAAEEEIDHLAWCEQRIRQLGSHPSVLNPLFYGLSFGIGAAAGLISDKVSLGFVAATENQVCKHLDEHLSNCQPETKSPAQFLSRCVSTKNTTQKVPGCRRFPLSGTSEVWHEPAGQSHDQKHLPHLKPL
jgi:demethoxyubiquinone hydroxylase (CLK1/Coq7/Cat5 family)